jgi:ABC-type nitrate/sulfonate/bicarbonate transport system ATPase subunit
MHSTLQPAHAPPVDRAPTAPLLTITGVTRSYALHGRRVPVLDGIDLALRQQRCAAIIGPSGSGKSTLLNLVAGLEEPDSGAILLDGTPQRLGRVGFMPQRDLLHPWRTALDNATVGLEIHGVGRREARRQAQALFGRFGLNGFEDARPWQLSGGMRQRVALARTVLAGGQLLLLDEPFGALDALTRVRMQDFLLETWSDLDRAAILVTHDVEEALLLADEVYVFSPRPASVVLRVAVPFPRPRQRALVADPQFLRLKIELLAALGVTPHSSGADR